MNSKAILATAVACLCVSSVQSASAADLTYEWYTVANNGDVMPTDASGDCGSCHDEIAGSGEPAATAPSASTATTSRPSTSRAWSYSAPAAAAARAAARGRASRSAASTCATWPSRGRCSWCSGATARCRSRTTPRSGKTESARIVQRVPVGAAHRRRIRHDRDARPVDAGVDVHARRTDGDPHGNGRHLHQFGAWHADDGRQHARRRVRARRASQTFPYFQVPVHGAVPAGTGFDQFPGSPAVTERTRSCSRAISRWMAPARRACSTATWSPRRQGARRADREFLHEDSGLDDDVLFGSTAPPSAGGKYAVFAGYDNEDEPDRGRHLPRAPRQQADRARDRREDRRPGAGSPTATKFERVRRVGVGVVERAPRAVLGRLGRRATGRRWSARTRATPPCGSVLHATPPEGTTGQVPEVQGFFVRDMQLGTTTVDRQDRRLGRRPHDRGFRLLELLRPRAGQGRGRGRRRHRGTGPLAFDVVRRRVGQRRARYLGVQGAIRTTRWLEDEQLYLLRDVAVRTGRTGASCSRPATLGATWTRRRRPAR